MWTHLKTDLIVKHHLWIFATHYDRNCWHINFSCFEWVMWSGTVYVNASPSFVYQGREKYIFSWLCIKLSCVLRSEGFAAVMTKNLTSRRDATWSNRNHWFGAYYSCIMYPVNGGSWFLWNNDNFVSCLRRRYSSLWMFLYCNLCVKESEWIGNCNNMF